MNTKTVLVIGRSGSNCANTKQCKIKLPAIIGSNHAKMMCKCIYSHTIILKKCSKSIFSWLTGCHITWILCPNAMLLSADTS